MFLLSSGQKAVDPGSGSNVAGAYWTKVAPTDLVTEEVAFNVSHPALQLNLTNWIA
jgi:hypothetical protein